MPNFTNFERNLDGANRGQNFVLKVYVIFGQIYYPLPFNKLKIDLHGKFSTACVFVYFKEGGKEQNEIILTDFERASNIWNYYHLVQCNN